MLFACGVAVAGVAPIVALPGITVASMVEVAREAVGGFPIEAFGVVVLVALLGAAWIDAGGPRRPPTEHWD